LYVWTLAKSGEYDDALSSIQIGCLEKIPLGWYLDGGKGS